MTDDKKEFSGDEILAGHHVTILSDRDRDIFLAMLDADDEPNEKLIEAFKIHKELIKEEKERDSKGHQGRTQRRLIKQ